MVAETTVFSSEALVNQHSFQHNAKSPSRNSNLTFLPREQGGCTSDELACLRSRNTSILQAANRPSAYPGGSHSPRFYFTPCIDGEFIQDYPIRLFEQGKFVHVPVMFGDDTNEGSGFAANASTPADVADFLVDQYPRLTVADTDAINAKYPLMAPIPGHAPYFPSASAAYGEVTFTCPSIHLSVICTVFRPRQDLELSR